MSNLFRTSSPPKASFFFHRYFVKTLTFLNNSKKVSNRIFLFVLIFSCLVGGWVLQTQRRVTFHLPDGSQESCSDSGLGDPEPSSTASTGQTLPLSFPQEEYYEQTSPNSRTEGDGNSDPESSECRGSALLRLRGSASICICHWLCFRRVFEVILDAV